MKWDEYGEISPILLYYLPSASCILCFVRTVSPRSRWQCVLPSVFASTMYMYVCHACGSLSYLICRSCSIWSSILFCPSFSVAAFIFLSQVGWLQPQLDLMLEHVCTIPPGPREGMQANFLICRNFWIIRKYFTKHAYAREKWF